MRKQNYVNYFLIPIQLSVLASHHDLSFVVEVFFCISRVKVIYIYIIDSDEMTSLLSLILYFSLPKC
jgi:hypothetical protein